MPADRVLVVDDDRDICRYVEVNLRLEGYDVSVEHDGETAVATALRLQPDLVLLDVMMPGIDGMEVCRRLTAGEQGPRVVMLTAKADAESRQIAAAAGASAYLSKPFSAVDLFKVVEGELTGGL